MNIHVPSTEEIHQIAFLTLHGWTLQEGQWRKEGHKRTVTKRRSCGCCTYEAECEWFDMEDAYWRAQPDG